jgi:hypothetical protein
MFFRLETSRRLRDKKVFHVRFDADAITEVSEKDGEKFPYQGCSALSSLPVPFEKENNHNNQVCGLCFAGSNAGRKLLVC